MQTQSIDTPGEGISAEEFRSRIEHVSAAIAKAGLAGLAAFGDCWRGANVTYFTEFRPLDGVSDIANAVVLLGAEQEPTLFVSEQCLGYVASVTRFKVRLFRKWATSCASSLTRIAAARSVWQAQLTFRRACSTG